VEPVWVEGVLGPGGEDTSWVGWEEGVAQGTEGFIYGSLGVLSIGVGDQVTGGVVEARGDIPVFGL
jgi:hypothetical protein